MTLGDKLSKLRKENHYTQEQLADTLGVSRQAVSKWESDTAYPETDKLIRICRLFDCSLDYLLLDKQADAAHPEPHLPENRIFIESPLNHTLVSCCKVAAAPVSHPTENQPKYLLRGIDEITALGEHSTQLGWYASKDDIEREISEISGALRSGKNCYTLKYEMQFEEKVLNSARKQTDTGESALPRLRIRERQSEKMLFGMPLWQIGKNAKGVVAVGIHARGILAIGLRAEGILACGLLSAGVFSFGLLAVGLLAIGLLAVGGIAAGTFALGILAAGAISLGIFSLGAIAVGDFSIGALAIGKYAALGDNARAMVAIGDSEVSGSVLEQLGSCSTQQVSDILHTLDRIVPPYLTWAKTLFQWLWLQ